MKVGAQLKSAALCLLSLALFASPLQAAQRYDFDKSHTRIFFDVSHLGFSMMQGQFRDFDGYFELDEKDAIGSSIKVSIDTASVDMYHEKLNKHLRNKDFFNVERFPEMAFKSTKVEKTGEQSARVTGQLTLLGVSQPVELNVVLNKLAPHPFSKKMTAGFTATGKLDRTAFGMKYGAGKIGSEVHIRIEVEGRPAK